MPQSSKWNFFSNHACVLISLAQNPNQSLREVALVVGITERAVQRIIADLEEANYLTRERQGRRNVYQINRDVEFRHSILSSHKLSEVLDIFVKDPVEDESDVERLLRNWTIGEHGSEVK
ncbi:MAG: helix-turn-helix transcriptional regulator [Opitutaceae bacterium]